MSALDLQETPPIDYTAPLTASGNLRRRARVSRVLEGGAVLAAAVAVAVMALVTWEVIHRGIGQITWSFLTNDLSQNGIGPAIVGTVLIVIFAALIAVPLGVMSAIYLTEFADPYARSARLLRSMLNLMQGLPTVVVGIFVFGLLASGTGQTGIAGSVALSIIMLPLIARGSQEALLVVPPTLREGTDALGVARWRSILGVILPSATGAIMTASILSIARAAGETAPLLLTDGIFAPQYQLNLFGHGVPNIPLFIFTSSETPDPSGIARAWGAALVLLAVILFANVGARILLARSRRRMGT